MAEFVMKGLVQKAGLEQQFEIASAAATTEEIGSPVYPPVRKLLAKHGISCEGKRARLLTRNDYAYYDWIIGMDAENDYDMRRILREDPENKIHLLLDFTDSPHDVADPWYTRDFEETWRDVQDGCSALLEQLRDSL